MASRAGASLCVILRIPALICAVALGLPSPVRAAYSAAAYFPLPDGGYWEFDDFTSTTVQSGTTLINGVATKRLVDEFGDSEFYSNDAQGVRLHRMIITEYPEITATFRTPLPIARAQANVGDRLDSSGKVDFLVQDYGAFIVNYTASARITGTEVVTVPYGTFQTVRLVLTLRMYGTVAGDPLDETTTGTLWLAPGIGVVKEYGPPPDEYTSRLVDTNVDELIPCIPINGTANADTLEGTPAEDCINGKAGADTMYGLGDNDIYTVDNTGDTVIEGAGEGRDTVRSSVTYALPAYVENLVLTGTAPINGGGNDLNNAITGNAAANLLNGKAGTDTLSGKSGNDTLNGGPGNDVLTGGGGLDRFLFTTALDGTGNVDRITDFLPADDTIALEDGVFRKLSPGPLPAAAFHVGATATTAAHRILYGPLSGALFYDADGTGPVLPVRFATLTTKPTLTNADFVVQ